jgi:hypothetical protein
MKLVEYGNARYIRRELRMLDKSKLLWEEIRPCCVALIVRSLRKRLVELHVIMHIAASYYVT